MQAPDHYRTFVADMGGLRARLECAVHDGTAPAAELQDALDEMRKRFARFEAAQARYFAERGLVSAADMKMTETV